MSPEIKELIERYLELKAQTEDQDFLLFNARNTNNIDEQHEFNEGLDEIQEELNDISHQIVQLLIRQSL